MKTKEIVRLTINYCDEFTFDELGDAIFFLKLWKKGKSVTVKASIEIEEVPIAIEEDPVYSELTPTCKPVYERGD